MANRERQINVAKSNYSVIDSEFDNMRDRFETEMGRVEDEMNRLRREFEGFTPKRHPNEFGGKRGDLQTSNQPPYSTTSTTTSSNSQQRAGAGHSPVQSMTTNGAVSTRPKYDPYLDNLQSPLIKDASDGKTLRLRFNVNQYRPEEVTVKTVDNRLLVHAKHEEKSAHRTVYREYNQEFMLPRGTDPESISSTLSTDGVLTVEAPFPHLAQASVRR